MTTLLLIIASTSIVSLLSLVGVFTIGLKNEVINKILSELVALSSGAMLGGAFLHVLPEGIERMNARLFFFIILLTLMLFLVIEKFLHWRHCHAGPDCAAHSMGYMNLIGDGVHNFIDGMVIASSFMLDIRLGFVTTTAIALHELPQEMGDYGVLIYSGFSRGRALFVNFLSGLAALFGGALGWALFGYVANMTAILLPVAAGSFIYISLSDMLPELRKEPKIKKFISNFFFILIGLLVVYLVGFLE